MSPMPRSESPDAVIKLAQYLAGLTTQQDAQREIGRALLSFFALDLVAFGDLDEAGKLRLGHWRATSVELRHRIGAAKEGALEDDVGAALVDGMAEALETGFLATRTVSTPDPLAVAFLPVRREDGGPAVLAMGQCTADPFPKDRLNLFLAIAGLVGTTISRLASERELRKHRRHLEALVQVRTADLVEANRRLEKEIGQRKRAQEVLRESEERYRQLFEGVGDAVLVLDSNLRIADCNEAAVERYGYSRVELLELTPADLVHPDCHDRFPAEMSRAWSRSVSTFETVFVHKDGTPIPVEANAQCIDYQMESTILAVLRDITERVKAEKRVEHLNRVLSAIRQVDQLIVRETDRDRLLRGACEVLVEARGYRQVWLALRDEAGSLRVRAEAGLGAGVPALKERLSRGQVPRCSRRALKTGEVVISTDTANACGECPLGSRHEDQTGMTVRLEHGEALYGVLCASIPAHLAEDEEEHRLFQEVGGDIALALHDLRLAEERAEMERRLRHHERLAAVGQLAAGIAHDFRNRLNPIMLYAELALKGGHLPAPLEDQMEAILGESKGMADLVQQILDFTSRAMIRPRRLDMVDLMESAVRGMRPRCHDDIALTMHAEPGRYLVWADPERLRQAIENLAKNACDAMPDGGEIRLEVSRAAELPLEDMTAVMPGREGAEEPRELNVGGWICLAVADTGTGMSEEVQAHIFEPFFTTKDVDQGTGLGLAQVYGIVRQHEGYVGVETEPGRGSTFRIYLPAHEDAGEGAGAVPETRGSAEHRQTILLVEPDHARRAAAEGMLASLGYEVVSAANGSQALALAQSPRWAGDRKRIHALIADVSGVEREIKGLLRELRRSHPGVRAVVMTGSRGESLTETLREMGFEAVVQKPFDLAALDEALRRG